MFAKCMIYVTLITIKEMNMYSKKIGLTLATILPLVLVGCGGGGDSSSDYSGGSTTSTQDNLNNGTRYYFLDYDLDDETGADNLSLEYSEILNKKFKKSFVNATLNEYVLTANKLYTPADIQSNSVTLNSLTSWTWTFVGDLKTEIKLEKVDIAGKNIFDTIFPGYRSLGFDNENSYSEAKKFLALYGKENFPSGSSCYRFISKKNNQEYFNFTTDEPFEQPFEEFDYENQSFVDSLNNLYKPLGWVYRYASGTWQNIPWTTIYDIDTGFANDDDNVVAVKYQNQTYLAEYNSDLEWTAAKDIKQWENLLGRTTTDKERIPKLKIESLKHGCQVFNGTAALKLDSFKSINWNRN